MKQQQDIEQAPSKMMSQQQQQDEQHVGRGSKRRPLGEQTGQQYDQLIGAIDQGTSSTRFLVFENGSGRLIASSQLEIKRITPREGWVEIDPNSIMSSVYATMANVHDQLMAKQDQLNLDPSDQRLPHCDTSFMDQKFMAGPQMLLKCIGICNQRESAVVWDSKTGQPLYNVIVWMDNRTKDIVDDMIDAAPGRDFNHLKDKTGLPMSTYFSAFKLRWLIDNVPEVQVALRDRRCLVGTVDSWILWNLTGKHLTDVTNASRTFLMDIETLQWDKTLCKQFKVPMEILPKILASADDFGSLQFGPFMGTPITGVIGDQSAALFGHNCLQLGQTKATFGTGCFIMQNIGPGPLKSGALKSVQREAKRGLITTVGYKLKNKPACYALEGSIKIAGAALTWLRDNMQLISNYEECDQLVNTTTNSAGVFFVPALGGLYSPYWDPNAAGLFIGLSQFTRREHLVRATFDSIAFQTNDILSLMHGVTNGLMIDGGLCKSDNLCQILADITGCDINRPSMCETSALGAAMVAGCGAGIWDYESMMAHSKTSHDYACSSKQTLHYPHETLNYDQNKFSHSSIQAKCQFKSSPPAPMTTTNNHKQQQSAEQEQRNHASNNKQNEQELQHQQQPTKYHRRSLRHRNGGRLMRNLDAGGGINDDAGGGGGGGASCSSGGAMTTTPVPASANYSSDDELDEDEDNASSGGHLASSETDYEAGLVVVSSDNVSSSGEYEQQHHQSTLPLTSNLPAVSENHATIAPKTRTLMNNSTINPSQQQQQQQHAASTSGYSSSDNFESGSSNSCQLTESMRLSDVTRTYSPVSSMATMGDVPTITSGRNSAVNGTEDLSSQASNPIIYKQQRSMMLATTKSSPTFPFNLANYMNQQHKQSILNDSDGTLTTIVGPVQQVNNRKFVEKAEDVADEVHEFGGRDSYGEDGYDSSTVSFDSYDDDDNHHHNQVVDEIEQGNEMACYGEMNDQDETADVCSLQQDVISTKTVDKQQQHYHHRRRQTSLVEKQMDVFQPYISLEHRTELVDTWRLAVTRSMQWTKVHHEEIRRIDYERLSSLPISMYVYFSIGLIALSGFLSGKSIMG